MSGLSEFGGERGIRTPGGRKTTPDFKSGALNRTLPSLRIYRRTPEDVANDKEVFGGCKAKNETFLPVCCLFRQLGYIDS